MSTPVQDGVDVWGRSAAVRRLAGHMIDPLYRFWFRVEVEGLEHLPASGPALLVANHAGALPVDAPLIVHALERELGRPVYVLHHDALRALPVLGTLLARNGGVTAHPDNANRLLADDGALVLVFPEGTKGTMKLAKNRYRLQRFGRGGFVASALRAGAPIVPVAVVGTEETMPSVASLKGPGSTRFPITLNSLVFGPPFAFVPLPTKIRIRVLPPLEPTEPPGLDSYSASTVAELAERVRSTLQAELDTMVSARRGVFRG